MIKDEFERKRREKKSLGVPLKKGEGLKLVQWSNSILWGEVINYVTLTDTSNY